MAVIRPLYRLAAYLWAAPNTLLGIAAGMLVLCLGGRVRLVSGAVEFSAGELGEWLARRPARYRFGAVTLGHVILGGSLTTLSALRRHEQVHVRQYERWGPFFLPAYALSSAWQIAHGRRGYRDNFFERQAYALADGQAPWSPAQGARGRSRSGGEAGSGKRSRTHA
jgi:hypothetical protein